MTFKSLNIKWLLLNFQTAKLPIVFTDHLRRLFMLLWLFPWPMTHLRSSGKGKKIKHNKSAVMIKHFDNHWDFYIWQKDPEECQCQPFFSGSAIKRKRTSREERGRLIFQQLRQCKEIRGLQFHWWLSDFFWLKLMPIFRLDLHNFGCLKTTWKMIKTKYYESEMVQK